MGASRLVEEAFAAPRPSRPGPLRREEARSPVSRPPLAACRRPPEHSSCSAFGPRAPRCPAAGTRGRPSRGCAQLPALTLWRAGGAASPGAEPLGPGSQPAPGCSPEDRGPSAVQGPEMSRPHCRVSGWVARGLSQLLESPFDCSLVIFPLVFSVVSF